MKVCSVCHGSHQNSAACNGEFLLDRTENPEAALGLIPGFQLDGLLTSTSSTATYRARETGSGRSCLIKIFTADEGNSERILRDAKIAAGLFHPGIAGLFEAGRLDDGRSFVASEDVDGRTLREVLDNVGNPDLLTTIEIIRQAAESLHALHLAGLVHGAINPRNIVLSMSAAGRPNVRLQHPDLGRTTQGSIISNRFLIDAEIDSLRYFAPEQCSGEEACAQSDIYSLGVVFYEMLSGSPPFDAPTAVELIHQQRNQQPPEVKIENFNLRMLVTHALTEALQKHPRVRQSSADLFARQLRHIEQLATHSSTPPPAGAIRVSSPVSMPVAVPPRIIEPAKPEVLMKPETSEERRVRFDVDAPAEKILQRATPGSARASLHDAGSDVAAIGTAERDEGAVRVFAETTAKKNSTPKPIYVVPRSRLRLWKKKLRSLAERVAPHAQESTPSIFESVDRSIGAPSIQPEAGEVVGPVKRRKVDWETPEDDIPSEAAVLAALESEGVSVPAVAVLKDEPRGTPAVPESPTAVEMPVVAEAPAAIDPPVSARTPRINEKPHVVEMRMKDRLQAETEDRPSKKLRTATRAPVARITPKVKAPEPAVTVSARMVPRMAGVDTISTKPGTPKSPTRRSGLGFKVNLADLEEITLVRPPSRRIKIDWEHAVPRPDLFTAKPSRPVEREIVFSPTLLGDTANAERVHGDEIFAGYGRSDARGIGRQRSVMIGGGIVALLALLLFGNDSVTRYFQTWSSADSVSNEAARATDIDPPVAAKTSKLRATKKDSAIIVKERNAPVPKVTARVDPKPSPRSSKSEKTKPAAGTRASEKPPRTSPGSATRPRIANVPN